MTSKFTVRVWAILLLAAGYGWAGGHFIPADARPEAYAFQCVMLTILFFFSVTFLKTSMGLSKHVPQEKPTLLPLTVFAVVTLLINVANIIHGALKPGPYGSHNTLSDLVPITLIMAGDMLWLLTLSRKAAKAAG